MELKITPENFKELLNKGYGLDSLYLLSLINEEYDIEQFCEDSHKIGAIYQFLLRKGLITETDKLTILGKEILQFANCEESKFVPKMKKSTEFEDWWKAFPGTDTFEYKGRRFTGSRSLRSNKPECEKKFNNILLEGEYTANQLIKALEFDVLQKKENSIRTGSNKLSFMQNSLTYLRQKSFEPFIELTENVQETNLTGGIDI